MGDHLSPVMEGFENPTMETVFKDLLKISSNPTSANSEKISFLKSILKQQKETADSLMRSSKKIGLVSQKISNRDSAYDAAFESDVTAPIPNMSGTLQGFTFLFFILSFVSLAIIMAIGVNQLSGNTTYAMMTFAAFVLIILVSVPLIFRYG